MPKLFAFVGLLLGLMACNESDEAPLAAIRYELGEMRTNAQGKPILVRLDNGQFVQPEQTLPPLQTDSTYRILVGYYPTADGTVKSWQLSPILAPLPSPHLSAENVAPVHLLALWRSPRYINLRVGIARSHSGQHSMGFIDQGTTTHPDGRRTLALQLYHHAHGDRKDYTQEYYFSCPIHQLNTRLRSGIDSLSFSVLTDEGMKNTRYLY